MKQLSIRDTVEFWHGRDFEREYARQLLLAGWSVMRCYELDGGQDKAPMLEGPYKGHRLPDLQVSGHGKSGWRELKEKTACNFTHSEGRYDHGIGLRCYRDYDAVQQISGLPVVLVIGEYSTGLILAQSLDKLGLPRIYPGDKMDPGGMAFWPRSSFDIWGRYDTTPGQLSIFSRPKRTIHYAPGHWK
jgi:hypothetical protein